MRKACGPVCNSCEVHNTDEHRCKPDRKEQPAWRPRDGLNKMFEKLTAEPYATRYSVQILSSPHTNGPWIVTMEDVISPQEADRLIEIGRLQGYQASGVVGGRGADGTYEKDVNDWRTSATAWCLDECSKDEHAMAVIERLSNLTGIPTGNSENLQLVKYDVGQFYNIHHDFIDFQVQKQPGPRILTAFIYLNDVVAGGGTNFDQLNITAIPKRGSVLLFPSVLDEDPMRQDWTTSHQALAVQEGVKYGANFWYHLRDWEGAVKRGCA
jgi:prolyl 4-hydroxylase